MLVVAIHIGNAACIRESCGEYFLVSTFFLFPSTSLILLLKIDLSIDNFLLTESPKGVDLLMLVKKQAGLYHEFISVTKNFRRGVDEQIRLHFTANNCVYCVVCTNKWAYTYM